MKLPKTNPGEKSQGKKSRRKLPNQMNCFFSGIELQSDDIHLSISEMQTVYLEIIDSAFPNLSKMHVQLTIVSVTVDSKVMIRRYDWDIRCVQQETRVDRVHFPAGRLRNAR